MKGVHPGTALTLAEAAEKSGFSENDILRQASQGKIGLYLWIPGPMLTRKGIISGWAQIPDSYLLLLIRYEKARVWSLIDSNGCEVEVAHSKLTGDDSVIGHLLARYGVGDIGDLPKEPDCSWDDDEMIAAWVGIKRNDLSVIPADLEILLSVAGCKSESSSQKENDDFVQPPNECRPGVVVTLPHMTKDLQAIFDVMWSSWKDYNSAFPPKQTNIAYEIDAALGWGGKGDMSKDPSRNAKAIAAIIKPDDLKSGHNE